MLGCICRIHLGIQWSRIWCSRAYAQHQHGRLQGLFPTLLIYLFMCSRASCSTQMSQNSCAPELLAQHKTSIYPCAPEILAQHKTSHQLCALGSTPNTWKHIYIICNWLIPSNKSSCSYAVWSLTQYIKIKHQGNIIINGAHAHKC